MSDSVINVIICDDHALFRAGVKTALSMKKDIKVIAEAEDGKKLLTLLPHLQPDVVLLDIQMPVMDGIHTLPEIKKNFPNIKVIMLTMHNEHSMITKLMEIGANSYLTKNSDSETIYEAIKTCYSQEYYFNALTNIALIDGLRNKRQEQQQVAAPIDVKLNENETAILKYMCEEKSTKEIADLVDLSPRTIESIRDRLKIKTGAKSMAGLVMYAIKAGIIEQK